MNKQEIDTYISDNYKMLFTIAKGLNYKRGNDFDPAMLISEAYVYCIEKSKQIECESMLQRYMINVINMNASFSHSKVRKEQEIRHQGLIGIEIEAESNIESLLEKEVTRQIQKAKISKYRQSLKCSIKKIIFDTYFIEKKRTGREMGEYFNISRRSGNAIISTLKKEINETV
jgi:hypothetical protein